MNIHTLFSILEGEASDEVAEKMRPRMARVFFDWNIISTG